MCEEQIGWRVGLRTGEEFAAQIVMEITKRQWVGVNP